MKNIMLFAAPALAIVTAATPASAAELVTNGGFETSNGFGWTATGNIEFNSRSPNGSGAASFNGGDRTPNGVLSQTVATAVGNAYTFGFDYFMNGRVSGQSMFASVLDGVTGASLGSRTVFSSSSTSQRLSLNFTALSNSSIIRFSDVPSNNTVSQDIYVDNVSVAAVPEPATWAMMLVGFGMVGAASRYRRRCVKLTYA